MKRPIEFAPGLYRGPQPQNRDDFEQLWNLGVKTVIDLESYCGDFSGHARREMVQHAWGFGMETLMVPCGVVMPPPDAATELVIGMLSLSRQPVYMHCLQGVDRTGYMVAACKVRRGLMTYNEAVTEMLDQGFHALRYWWWAYFLWRFLGCPSEDV